MGTRQRGALGDAVAQLERGAVAAWDDLAGRCRWTLWGRLTTQGAASGEEALAIAEAWARDLRTRYPGVVVLLGAHTDTLTRHVHFLLFMPARGLPGPLQERGDAFAKGLTKGLLLNWPSRQQRQASGRWLWFERYRPAKGRSGAYLAREPDRVLCVGTPVPVSPQLWPAHRCTPP